MERIRTLLVDDENDSREVLVTLIEKYFPEIELVGQAANIETAYQLVGELNPGLLFLDIQMPKGSGFDLLKKFEEIPFEVIFITSYDKYAINAIKFSALDYLLKPVEIDDLRTAIQKTVKRIESKGNKGTQIINLLHSLDTDVPDRKIAVHSGEKVKMLSELDIVHIEGDGRYCHLTMLGKDVFTTAKNLKEFESYFSNTPNFVRISKDFLINVKHIKSYSKGEPCIIEMVSGTTFEVSRRKKTEVLEHLKKIR